jgi:phosphodiesterase/alkaline phosphatase D-like protein
MSNRAITASCHSLLIRMLSRLGHCAMGASLGLFAAVALTAALGQPMAADTTPNTVTKPAATTGTAASITQATAILAGSVNPHGGDTHVVFAYGTSSTLAGAKKTPSVDIGSGATSLVVRAKLTGLIAKTKYYCRVQATNSAGTTNGAIVSFTTAVAMKPTATTGAASSITKSTATIGGSVNPHGADTRVVFDYGTSSTLPRPKKTVIVDLGVGTTAVAASANLSGLTPGTKYYYRVQAANSAGATIGIVKSFTTVAAVKPTVTTDPASVFSSTTASVSATVNPNGADTHVVFAYGKSSTLSGASMTASYDLGSGTTLIGEGVALSGLTAATKYYYQARATNIAGTADGAIESFTTEGASATVTTGTASSITPTTAIIAGNVIPNGLDTHTVFAYGTISTLSGASKTTSVDLGSGTATVGVSANLSGLTAATKYYYQVQATNSAGPTNGAILSFTTAAAMKPSATTGAASSVTATTATIAGSVNPNGTDTHFVFAYGTSSTLSGASKTTSVDLGSGTAAVGASANLSGLIAATKYYYQVQATNSGGTTNGAINSFTTTPSPGSGYAFLPVAPCRVADTRNADGPFGGPTLVAGTSREFDVPQSACGIPSTAVAYSLNVTVMPSGSLDHLTLWPTGQTQPNTFTLTSDDGRIKANAAITSAGTHGGVSVYASDATDITLDINGYFVPESAASSLAFFPVAPCRIADTRNASGPLGGPFLAAGSSRGFPVLSSNCSIPSTAQAYSLNVTAVPHAALSSLTVWATGQTQPSVETLNAPTGTEVANAAIVAAGTSGQVSVFTSDDSDVLLDINGYFAPPGPGGLALYNVTPCRVIDTRPNTFDGADVIDVQGSTCAPPSSAKAYILNATAVPPGALDSLSLWPDGVAQPNVSTLYATDGAATSNMAIVGTSNGKVDALGSDATNLILDISSYFARCGMCTTTGWSGQVQCVKTVTGPSYSNHNTQTWTVLPGISQKPTGQTLYPTRWESTGSGSTASQTWVINASGSGQLAVFTNGPGVNFARFNSQIAVPNGYQATPPPNYTEYEYQWLPFLNSDPNATSVSGNSSTTSVTCDSPVEPGGSSCTVACNWSFTKQ